MTRATGPLTPLDFVRLWHDEKANLLATFLNEGSGCAVATLIRATGLSPAQTASLSAVLDGVIADTMYTLLLGLDGSGSVGGRQESYRLLDETGAQLAGDGRLEAAAWQVFHGRKS